MSAADPDRHELARVANSAAHEAGTRIAAISTGAFALAAAGLDVTVAYTNRPRPLDVRGAPADHDRERAVAGADVAAGDRRVEEADPEFRSDIATANRTAPLRRVLSNSFGFGGSNCSLVLGRGRRAADA